MSAESFDGKCLFTKCYARGVTFAHIILVLGGHLGQLRAKVMVGRFMWELCVRVIRLSRRDSLPKHEHISSAFVKILLTDFLYYRVPKYNR